MPCKPGESWAQAQGEGVLELLCAGSVDEAVRKTEGSKAYAGASSQRCAEGPSPSCFQGHP